MKAVSDFLDNIPTIEIEKRLFSLSKFGFITKSKNGNHDIQEQALILLTDNITVELLYGGAAGGAKSWTGCVWLFFMCLLYPGTRWFIGREELKRLRESTLITFFKVLKRYAANKDWKYNGQDHFIEFSNGSRIDLLDLKYLPSDHLYERYGSIEYTGGWIEEGGEVNFAAFDTLKSRIGRHLNDKYGLLRKILVTCNPKRNWIYTYFYKPFKEGKLKGTQKFLKALLYDNPHRESGYENALKSITDPIKRARLLDGNFEYDDDPAALCDYDAISDVFTNDHVLPTDKKSISADLAMKGRDRFICGFWRGNVCNILVDKPQATGKSIETDIKNLMIKWKVGNSRTVVDSDGMGSYLESYLTGIKEFHGNERAKDQKEYINLKSECGYKLAELINKRDIRIICSPEQQERIKEELAVLKADNIDYDEKKKKIIKKDTMRELLQRSPDYLDMLLMNMVFHIKKTTVIISENKQYDEYGEAVEDSNKPNPLDWVE